MSAQILYRFLGGQIKADEFNFARAPSGSQHVPRPGAIVRFQDAEGGPRRPQPITRRLRVVGEAEVVYIGAQEKIIVPCELAEDVEMVDRE